MLVLGGLGAAHCCQAHATAGLKTGLYARAALVLVLRGFLLVGLCPCESDAGPRRKPQVERRLLARRCGRHSRCTRWPQRGACCKLSRK